MRLGRIAFIFLAIWIVFLGGSAYYALIFPIRVLHHSLMTILLAGWLIHQLRQKRGLPYTPLNKPLAAAILIWIISAVFSSDPRMAFEHLWFQLLHVLLFLALVDMFQKGRDRLVIETQFMQGAAVLFLSALELGSWFFGLGLTPGAPGGWAAALGADLPLPLTLPRLSLAMNISTLVAGYTSPLTLFAAIWALTTPRRDYRIVLALLSLGLLVVTLLTASRGGLLSLITATGLIVGFRLWGDTQEGRHRWRRILISAAAVASLLAIVGYTILSTTRARAVDVGDAGRLDMWKSAISMTADDPLTGVGPGLYGRAFRTYRDATIVQDKLASAHNAYLNTAAETGLTGVVISLWLAIAVALSTYQHWKQTVSPVQKRRIEAAFAALVGLGIHSMVDTFTITPIVLLMLVLIVFCIIPTDIESRLRPRKSTARGFALAAVLIVLGYGAGFIQLDRAQAAYQSSLSTHDPEPALEAARTAVILDPYLRLYHLHLAQLEAQWSTPEIGIAAYRQALQLEPTWDAGWINLAALEQADGETAAALESLRQARVINVLNAASTRWAEWAEKTQSAPENEIIAAYRDGIRSINYLPLSHYWWETPLRQAALNQLLGDLPLDQQYRILRVHDPTRAATLVPETPVTGREWLATALAKLDSGDISSALTAFDQAIALLRINGDAYAGRAQAHFAIGDIHGAERDLQIAVLLGTFAEQPNAIRAKWVTNVDSEMIYRWRVDAVPATTVSGEFAAVLYSRPGTFPLRPEVSMIGPGRSVMEPWYQIAAEREQKGDLKGALQAYQAIADYAPDEAEAIEQIIRLTGLVP